MSKTARLMKDSGIEWIGEIPVGWEVRKNKYLLDFMYSGGTPTATNDLFYTDDGGIPFVSISDLTKGDLLMETAKKVTNEGILDKKLRILPTGTLLYSIYATIGAVTELRINATISQAILALGINTQLINKGLYRYDLLAMRDHVISDANGNTQNNLNAQKVNNFIFPLPPLPEQQKIADYLDEKCGKIDLVIAKSEEIIEKLKAYKLSLITEAVTKGLDPNAPMKDSGIEWIGEIPRGWEVRRLRFLCSVQTGDMDTQDNDPDGEYPFYVRSPIVEHSRSFTFDNEAVLMAGDGVGAGKVFHHVIGKYGCHQRVYSMSDFNNIIGKFLYYYLIVNFYKKIEESNAKSTVDSVRLPMLKDFPVSLPPLPEQQKIAAYLDAKTAAIDKNIADRQTLIEKLTAYKKSLIYEAVTGKKEI